MSAAEQKTLLRVIDDECRYLSALITDLFLLTEMPLQQEGRELARVQEILREEVDRSRLRPIFLHLDIGSSAEACLWTF